MASEHKAKQYICHYPIKVPSSNVQDSQKGWFGIVLPSTYLHEMAALTTPLATLWLQSNDFTLTK